MIDVRVLAPAGGDGLRDPAVEASARLSFLSACAFALAVVLNVRSATLAACVGMVLLLASVYQATESLAPFISELRLTAALVAIALVAAVVPDEVNPAASNWLFAAVPAVAGVLAIAELARAWTRRHLPLAGVALIAVGAVAGIWLIQSAKGTGIDTVLLHEQTAAALARGANPYTAAVTVPDGAPGASADSRIFGYPYPPVVALAYSVSTWLGGDPRWGSLVSWIAVALCGLELARRQGWGGGPVRPFLLLMALPGVSMILQTGWTEMLSVALIALAAVTWNRRPIVSGIALGAALASKQYFVVALPLLALYRGPQWQRRIVAAFGTAALLILPAFAWSARDAWRSMFLFLAQSPARSDSSNLVGVVASFGVHWKLPVWIGLGVPLGLTTLIARRVKCSAELWRALAVGLAVFMLLASQAMPNYWFLVAVVALFGSQPLVDSQPLAGSHAT